MLYQAEPRPDKIRAAVFRIIGVESAERSELIIAELAAFPPVKMFSLLRTNLGFLLFSHKFSSRFEFGLSVLISLICVISGKVLVFQRAQRIQRQKFLIVAQPGCG